jgi:hypothetical protein
MDKKNGHAVTLDPAHAKAEPGSKRKDRRAYNAAPLLYPAAKEFQNTLPENYPSWNYLLSKVKECFNGELSSAPQQFVFDISVPSEEAVYSYFFDMDFIKARSYEELDSILRDLEEGLEKEVQSHPPFFAALAKFKRAFNKLFFKNP